MVKPLLSNTNMANKCSCGTWNNDSAKFCRNCGAKLAISSQNNQSGNSHPSTKYQTSGTSSFDTKMGAGAKIILTILVIALFIGISVATGGIGTISGVVMVPALQQIWK